MVFWVYILECIDRMRKHAFYTGYTNNLSRRVQEHAEGRGAKFTRGKQVTLRYYETFPTRQLAMRRELAIKALSRWRKSQLVSTFPARLSFSPQIMY